MAFLAVKVPEEVAKHLWRVDVPGRREQQDWAHITLLYLGKDVPLVKLAQVLMAVYPVAQGTQPFPATVTSTSSFPAGDDGVPIICPVHSPGLHQLQARLKWALQQAGIPLDDKYPEYKPHITLSYVEENHALQPLPGKLIEPFCWTVTEFGIWGADDGDGRVSVNLPFDRYEARTAALDGALRYIKASQRCSTPT